MVNDLALTCTRWDTTSTSVVKYFNGVIGLGTSPKLIENICIIIEMKEKFWFISETWVKVYRHE